MKWQDFFTLLPAPYSSLEIGTYSVHWNHRMRSRAGVCSPRVGEIHLNPHLLKDPGDFEKTLVHELCHLVVFRSWPRAEAHGKKWKALMSFCGFKPERCHNLEGAKVHRQKRWDLYCACRTHQVTTRFLNKVKRGGRYRCLSCHSLLFQS